MTSRSKRFDDEWRRKTSSALAARWRARAKKMGLEPKDVVNSRSYIREWLGRIPNMCRYCSDALKPGNIGFDHATPPNRGGSLFVQNVDIICRRCNETKGSMTRDEFKWLRTSVFALMPEGAVDVFRRLRAGGKILRSIK